MNKAIQKLLESNKIKYKNIEHRKVYTAFNEAETLASDARGVVKTVLIKLSKPTLLTITNAVSKKATKPANLSGNTIDFVLVAVPAKHRVDFKKIAKTINDHQLKGYKLLLKSNPKTKKPVVIQTKMANEKDIEKRLKTKVGLLSAFSSLYNLPLLLDKKLVKSKKLIIAAGSYTESVELSTKDFLKITNGLEGNFCQ